MNGEALEGLVNHSLRFTRDAFGRGTGYELAGGSGIIQRMETGFDGLGRLSSAAMDDLDPALFLYDTAYDTVGRLDKVCYPFAVDRTIAPRWTPSDPDHLLYLNKDYQALAGQSTERDSSGLVTASQWQYRDHESSVMYGYNAKRELTEEQLYYGGESCSRFMGYDAMGNRKGNAHEDTGSGRCGELEYVSNGLNQYTALSDRFYNESGHYESRVFVPEYDADGNQTKVESSTGVWEVAYNAQDRPVCFMQGIRRIECKYDCKGRRVEKSLYENGRLTGRRYYAYAGFLLLAEWEAAEGSPRLLHTWHWDPSHPVATRPMIMTMWEGQSRTHYAYLHSLNKNVMELADESGNVAAQYEYDAFGNILSMSGPLASNNPFRFSSEYFDDELGLVYYNYRHYNPLEGRWLSREPLGEEEMANLYGFCENDSVNGFDSLGLIRLDAYDTPASASTAFAQATGRNDNAPDLREFASQAISGLFDAGEAFSQAIIDGFLKPCREACAAYRVSRNAESNMADAVSTALLMGLSRATGGMYLMEAIWGTQILLDNNGELRNRELNAKERYELAAIGIISVGLAGVGLVANAGKSGITQMVSTEASGALSSGGSTVVQTTSKLVNTPVTRPIKELRDLKLKDAHHILQDATVNGYITNYNSRLAPRIQLLGPPTKVGSPHYYATQYQRTAPYGGTLGAELKVGYNALLKAGLPKGEALQATKESAMYFKRIMGSNYSAKTPTKIPYTRPVNR